MNKEGTEEFLYLADPQRHLMKKTTLEGKELFTLTVPLESGLYNSAEEYHPTNVATAPNGDFYIADGYGKSWIHQYTAESKVHPVFRWPRQGTRPDALLAWANGGHARPGSRAGGRRPQQPAPAVLHAGWPAHLLS